MKKTILLSIVALILSNSAFAQLSSYQSPFGGTYTGDFKKYSPESKKEEKIQQSKVELTRMVLLNDNETLQNNVNIDDVIRYVKLLEKNTVNTLNNLTQPNRIVLEVSVSRDEHKIRLALKNGLTEKDNETIGKLEKILNKIRPFTTNENILLHIYFNVDTTLPKNTN